MPKYAFGALVLSIVLPSIAAAQSPQAATLDAFRLAFVSPQRAFYESNDGKAAAAKLNSLQSQASREVDARNTKLKTMQQDLAERGSVLAETARREREQQIERFQLDMQRFMEDAQAEFLGVQRSLEKAFLGKFGNAVITVAKKRGLLFVLNQDSGVLAYGDPSLDITKDVVEIVNQP